MQALFQKYPGEICIVGDDGVHSIQRTGGKAPLTGVLPPDKMREMNAYIFVTDIICDEDIEEIKRLVDHVEYFQINIK